MASIGQSSVMERELTVEQEKKILLFWSLTVWLIVMNTTMFNVALPTILFDMSLSSTQTSWIVSGYSITFAISSLTYSRLSDYLPMSRLLTIGLVVLGIASLIGFMAQQYWLLLLARVLQASGAGAVPGLAMVLAGRYIPIERRGRAMAIIGSAASLGFGLGPVVGGLITQFLGWNFLFGITFFVVLLIPIFRKLLPIEMVQRGDFDFVGASLTAISISVVLLYFSNLSVSLLVTAAVLFFIWWKYLHRAKSPFIQPALFLHQGYLRLLLMAIAAFLTHFSTLFLMPMMLTNYFDKNPLEVGMMIFPGAMLSAMSANYIGRMIDLYGNKLVLLIGQGAVITATMTFAFLSSYSPYFIMIAYCFMSPGFSALTSSISNEVSRVLPLENLGAGMGLLQLVQFIGGGLGVTLSGLFIALQSDFALHIIYRNVYLFLCTLVAVSMVVAIIYFRRQVSQTRELEM